MQSIRVMAHIIKPWPKIRKKIESNFNKSKFVEINNGINSLHSFKSSDSHEFSRCYFNTILASAFTGVKATRINKVTLPVYFSFGKNCKVCKNNTSVANKLL